MSDPLYPTQCAGCGEFLFGKVNFCPYCGLPDPSPAGQGPSQRETEEEKLGPAPTMEEAPAEKPREDTKEPVPEKIPAEPVSDAPQEKEPVAEEPSKKPEPEPQQEAPAVREPEKAPEKAAEPPAHKPIEAERATPPAPIPEPKPSSSKWIAIAAGLAIVLSVLFYVMKHGKDNGDPGTGTGAGPEQTAAQPASVACDSELALAEDALRQGDRLVIAVAQTANQQNLLNGAKRLYGISPERYGPEKERAEKLLNESMGKQDQAAKDYQDAIVKLGNAKEENVSCALEKLRASSTDNRAKAITKLLSQHLKYLQKGGKPDKGRWISDFTSKFGTAGGSGRSETAGKLASSSGAAEAAASAPAEGAAGNGYEAQLEDADALIDKKDYPQALKMLADIIARCQDNKTLAQAHFSRGLLFCEEMNKPDQAIQDFQAVIAGNSDAASTANAHYYLGWIYYRKKDDPKTALVHLRTVLDKYPDSPMAQTAQFLTQEAENNLK